FAGFHADSNQRLISCSRDNTIRTWNTETYGDYVAAVRELVESIREPSVSRHEPSEPNNDVRLRIAHKDAPQQIRSQRLDRLHQTVNGNGVTAGNVNRPQKASRYILTGAQPERRPAHRFQQAGSVFSAEFSRDSQRLIVGANDLAAHAFHTDTGERTLVMSMLSPREPFYAPEKNNFVEGHIPEIVSLLFLPPKGDLLLTFDYFGSLSVWDAKADKDGIGFEKARLLPGLPLDEQSVGEPYEVEDPSCEVAVSPDGKWLIAGVVRNDGGSRLTTSKDEYFAAIWDTSQVTAAGKSAPRKELRGEFAHQITAAAISPQSKRAVTATRRGAFVLWDIESTKVIASAAGAHNSDGVSGVFFRSEDEFFSAGFDGRVIRWTHENGELHQTEIERPAGHELPDFIIRLRPDPKGFRFVSSDLKKDLAADRYYLTLNLWSEDAGWRRLPVSIAAPQDDLSKPYRHDVSWSEDGSRILYVHDGTIIVLNAETLQPVQGFQLPLGNNAMRGAIAPQSDADTRVATFDGRFAHLWNLTTGKHIAEFRSHGPVVRAAFSADRRFVATASDSIRVFSSDETSPDHGRPVFRLPSEEVGNRLIEQVRFSPAANDYRIASVNSAGDVRLWQWEPGGAPPTEPVFASGNAMSSPPEWLEDEGTAVTNQIVWGADGRILAAIQRGRMRVWRIQGAGVTELSVKYPEGVTADTCAFNALDISADGNRIAGGGVRLNESDDLVSWGLIWEISGEELLPSARIPAEGFRRHNAAPASASNDVVLRGITAIAFDEPAHEIVTGGADSNVLRWSDIEGTPEEPAELLSIAYKEGLSGEGFTDPHPAPITAVDVAENGTVVSTDESGFIVLWPPSR
ncbi:MAG: WD40 repeat domain-containing protein, partial [Planctomycetaceae bacterium]|nr:WD40 repeat domain-containing protein [Planctomycetaceae bacterium]